MPIFKTFTNAHHYFFFNNFNVAFQPSQTKQVERTDKNSFMPDTRKAYAVAQMVEKLRYKPKGQGIDSFRPHYSLGVDSALTEKITRNIN